MRSALPQEERVYRELGRYISPWAPAFLGSFKRLDWHVLLLEDVGPQTMPPWSPAKARRSRALATRPSMRVRTAGRLPRWLSRTEHHEFAGFWRSLSESGELAKTAALAHRRAEEAREWLDVALPLLRDNAERLLRLRAPHTLLHLDTRSDNTRLQGEQLRMFDWNFACVGPARVGRRGVRPGDRGGRRAAGRADTRAGTRRSCPCATGTSTPASPGSPATSPTAPGVHRSRACRGSARFNAVSSRSRSRGPRGGSRYPSRAGSSRWLTNAGVARPPCAARPPRDGVRREARDGRARARPARAARDATAAGRAQGARAQRCRASRPLSHVRVRRQHAPGDQPDAVRSVRHPADGHEAPRDHGVRR